MKRTIFIGLVLISLVLLSACATESRIKIGDIVTLSYSGEIPFYVSFSAYKESSNAGVTGGIKEYEYVSKELIESGKKFYVESGTKVQILDYKVFEEIYEVRIRSGDKEGFKGWVLQHYVKSDVTYVSSETSIGKIVNISVNDDDNNNYKTKISFSMETPATVEINGKNYVIEIVGANIDDSSIHISVNEIIKSMQSGDTKTINYLEFSVKEIFFPTKTGEKLLANIDFGYAKVLNPMTKEIIGEQCTIVYLNSGGIFLSGNLDCSDNKKCVRLNKGDIGYFCDEPGTAGYGCYGVCSQTSSDTTNVPTSEKIVSGEESFCTSGCEMYAVIDGYSPGTTIYNYYVNTCVNACLSDE